MNWSSQIIAVTQEYQMRHSQSVNTTYTINNNINNNINERQEYDNETINNHNDNHLLWQAKQNDQDIFNAIFEIKG